MGPVPRGGMLQHFWWQELPLFLSLSLQIADIFSPIPSCMNLIQHDIETSPRVVVCSHPCSLPEHKKKVVRFKVLVYLSHTQSYRV